MNPNTNKYVIVFITSLGSGIPDFGMMTPVHPPRGMNSVRLNPAVAEYLMFITGIWPGTDDSLSFIRLILDKSLMGHVSRIEPPLRELHIR